MTSYADNRKAKFDYEFLKTFTAGIELGGSEVKSVRAGLMNLAGSYVSIRGGEAYLLGADIPPYQPKNQTAEYDPRRVRRLLLTKKELEELSDADATKALTIVPISVYNKGRFIKLDLAIAR